MAKKKVSKKYALNEFKTVGLTIILYAMFVLYVPLVLDELFASYKIEEINGINILLLCKSLLMIIGTILPFMILRLSTRNYSKIQDKVAYDFKNIVSQAIVFFTLTSIAIFVITAVANSLDYQGHLVSGIGISISSEYMLDPIYIVTFIIISPVLEEYAFRGVLLNTLSKYGKFFALYSSAIIFALAHGLFTEIIPSFVMGLILGKIALRYKSIKPVIYIHVIFNAILYLLFLLPESLSMASAIILALIYIVAAYLVLTGRYRKITIKKARSANDVSLLFIQTGTVFISLVLLIVNSVLTGLIS